jgi:diaminopimelate epimerase
MQFSKAEGLGNDFIIIHQNSLDSPDWPALACKICERHTGIGADGLLIYQALPHRTPGSYQMRIFNADGSEAEVSGNGLRCLAAHLCAGPELKADRVSIETVSGDHLLIRIATCHPTYWFLANMGQPIMEPARLDLKGIVGSESLIGYEISLGTRTVKATLTSMGNPHCTLFVDDFEQTDWEDTGKRLESHDLFPRRINIEFVHVIDRRNIEVRFWERGVGKTLSSGTGASAAVVASILNGLTEREVAVHTLGGDLEIHWSEDQYVYLKGPARLICQGEYDAS